MTHNEVQANKNMSSAISLLKRIQMKSEYHSVRLYPSEISSEKNWDHPGIGKIAMLNFQCSE